MSFGDRARKGLAGLVLLGASAGLGGCGALIIAAGEENAAHVRGHYEVEAAKIRAGQTNVSNGFSTADTPLIPLAVYAANDVKDLNRNGIIEFPQEVKGLSDTFETNQRIEIYFQLPHSYSHGSYILLDSRERVIEQFERTSTCSALYNMSDQELNQLFPEGIPEGQINRLPPGRYKSTFFGDGQLIASKDFEVK